jgi:hypothetical protein
MRVPLDKLEILLPGFHEDLHNGTDISHSSPEVLWTTIDNVTNREYGMIRVPPHHLHRIKRSTPHRLVISNLQSWIDQLSAVSSENLDDRAHYSSIVPNFRLDVYHNLDEIYDYISKLASRSSGVTAFDIGTFFLPCTLSLHPQN